jgi:hypothetical protein
VVAKAAPTTKIEPYMIFFVLCESILIPRVYFMLM